MAARWLSAPPSASAADDPVAYSFAVMGCERYASTNRPTVHGTWQIIAGNGGSQLDGRWIRRADNGYFGFAVVRVTASGRAFVESHGRDYPPGQYLAPSPAEQFPTTIRDAGEITFALS